MHIGVCICSRWCSEESGVRQRRVGHTIWHNFESFDSSRPSEVWGGHGHQWLDASITTPQPGCFVQAATKSTSPCESLSAVQANWLPLPQMIQPSTVGVGSVVRWRSLVPRGSSGEPMKTARCSPSDSSRWQGSSAAMHALAWLSCDSYCVSKRMGDATQQSLPMRWSKPWRRRPRLTESICAQRKGRFLDSISDGLQLASCLPAP